MNVKELITKLKTKPPEAPVRFRCTQCGERLEDMGLLEGGDVSRVELWQLKAVITEEVEDEVVMLRDF